MVCLPHSASHVTPKTPIRHSPTRIDLIMPMWITETTRTPRHQWTLHRNILGNQWTIVLPSNFRVRAWKLKRQEPWGSDEHTTYHWATVPEKEQMAAVINVADTPDRNGGNGAVLTLQNHQPPKVPTGQLVLHPNNSRHTFVFTSQPENKAINFQMHNAIRKPPTEKDSSRSTLRDMDSHVQTHCHAPTHTKKATSTHQNFTGHWFAFTNQSQRSNKLNNAPRDELENMHPRNLQHKRLSLLNGRLPNMRPCCWFLCYCSCPITERTQTKWNCAPLTISMKQCAPRANAEIVTELMLRRTPPIKSIQRKIPPDCLAIVLVLSIECAWERTCW